MVHKQLRILGIDFAVMVEVPGICGTASRKANCRIDDGQVLLINIAIAIQIAGSPAATGINGADPFPGVLYQHRVRGAAEKDRFPPRFVISHGGYGAWSWPRAGDLRPAHAIPFPSVSEDSPGRVITSEEDRAM